MTPREHLAAAVEGWNRFWFDEVSTATLAVFRIVFGLILFFWTLSLLPELSPIFTKSGIFPQQAHYSGGGWGLLGEFPSHTAVVIVWAVLLVASIALTLGVFSQARCRGRLHRASSPSSSGTRTSSTPGDGLIRLIAFYLIFAPASASLSLLTFLRDRDEFWTFPGGPSGRCGCCSSSSAPSTSSPSGTRRAARRGTTGPRSRSPCGSPTSGGFPVPGFVTHSLLLSNLLSFGTLVIELSLAILVWNRRLRPWVLLAGLSLHLGIEYSVRVGFFGLSIMSMYLLWVPPERMEALLLALRRRLSRSPAAVRASPPPPALAPRGRRGSRTCRGRRRRAGWRPSRGRRPRAGSRTARAQRRAGERAGAGRWRRRRCRRRRRFGVPALEVGRARSRVARAPARGTRARSARSGARSRSVMSTRRAVGDVAVGPRRVPALGGARVGSNRRRLREQHEGPLARCSPRAEPRSEAAISSRVPPRWTVAAPARTPARPGDRAGRAQSSLKTPGP